MQLWVPLPFALDTIHVLSEDKLAGTTCYIFINPSAKNNGNMFLIWKDVTP